MGNIKSEAEFILNKDGSTYHLSLLPKHISDTIITVGDPGRVLQIAQYFDSIEFEINKREFVTITGTYKKKKISVISTGIGADNMEIFFNEIDALANIDFSKREYKSRRKKLKLYRLGTSGAIQSDIGIGSHLLSAHAVGIDNVISFYSYKQNEFQANVAKGIEKEIQLPAKPYVASASESLVASLSGDYQPVNTLTAPGFYAPQGRSLRAESLFPKMLDQASRFHQYDFWISNIEMETASFYAFAQLLGHHAVCINAVLTNRMKNSFSKNPTRIVESMIKKLLNDLVQAD